MHVERCSGTIISIPFQQHKVDALFHHIVSHEEHARDKPIILRLHGVLGNLLDETEHDLPQCLAQEGYSSLTINTLLANLGLFFGYGIFDDTMPQIDAACDYLRDLGRQKIVIAGHGLGGCMAIRYGARRSDPARFPNIQGIIAIATAYSLPDTIRRRWNRFDSDPSYEEMYQRAKRVGAPEPGNEEASDETIVVQKAHGPTTLPKDSEIYTLKTWWGLAGPEAEGPKAYKHIGGIRVPILLVHGKKDDMITQDEAESLGKMATQAGNPDVTVTHLNAGHTFEGNHEELGKSIVDWLRHRFR